MSRDSLSHDPRQNSTFREGQRQRRKKAPQDALYPGYELQEASGCDGREAESLKAERDDSPRAYLLAKRAFLLRDSELETMTELGTFRVAASGDLARFAYSGDAARMERDLHRLQAQGLVVERTVPISGRSTLRVLALSKNGKRVLQNSKRIPENQAIYHGIVRPRDAKHDSELYRVFKTEAARIEKSGGRPLRVVLDYELQRDLNRDRARLGEKRNDPDEIDRLASKHGLAVVNEKIPLPDMRIEYQTSELELRRVDLELATRHYRPRGLAEKAKAGFLLYSHREDASRLRRILDQQELTARILAL